MSDRMDTEALRALLDEATPGPWFARETYVHDKHVWFDAQGARHGDTPNIAFDYDTEANARLIAQTPALAAEVLELRADGETLTEVKAVLEGLLKFAEQYSGGVKHERLKAKARAALAQINGKEG